MNQKSTNPAEIDSNPVTRVLRIFEQRKDQLRFPDVDAEKLKDFQKAVQKEQEAVFALEEKLAEAREALVMAEKELREKTEKAHAYLQIFATGDAELEAELTQIKWSGTERAGRKRRPISQKKTGTKTSPAEEKGTQEESVPQIAAE